MSFFSRLRSSKIAPLFTLLVLLAPMLPRVARADVAGADPTGLPGVYGASLGVPETGAAVANGSVNPVSVNPSTGEASTTIPFQLPTARGRAQPHLALTYSSSAGASDGGWGWSLNIPSIQRTPLAGPPTYADPANNAQFNPTTGDRFSFNGQPLVPICTVGFTSCAANGITLANANYTEAFPAMVVAGWTYFRLETAADDARFFWSANHLTWVVQYKSGETLELGAALGSDVLEAAIDYDFTQQTYLGYAGAPPFRWSLVRQYDSEMQSGVPVNRILYYWQLANNGENNGSTAADGEMRMYLTDITYTLPTGTSAEYAQPFGAFADHVRLVWNNYEYATVPPTVPFSVFQPPVWRARPHQVLSRVDISAVYDPDTTGRGNDATYTRRLVRRYWLTHRQDADYKYSNRVLLTSAQIEGRCTTPGADLENPTSFDISPTSGCPELPPTTYAYTQPTQQFTATSLANLNPELATGYVYAQNPNLFDFNSDGVPDLVYWNGAITGPMTFAGNVVNILASNTADTFQNPVSLAGATTPAGFTYPTNNYPPSTYGPFSNNNTPTPTAPIIGNFAGDGNMNMLSPGQYTNSTGAFQFGVFTPALSGNSYILQGLSTQGFQFWQWAPNSNAGSCDCGEEVFAENVLGIVDVDGDGYLDALTDTQVENPGPDDAPAAAPYVHLLSLRTTSQAVTGVVSPFGMAAPNAVTGPIPNYCPSQLYNVAPPQSLPPNGQYVAMVQAEQLTASGGTQINTACRLFSDVCPDLQPPPANGWRDTLLNFFADINGDGLVDWIVADPTGAYYIANNGYGVSPNTANVGYALGHGDGTFGLCAGGKNACAGGDRFNGLTLFGNVPTVPQGSTYRMDDVNGDGLPDLLVLTTTGMTLYLNEQGTSFGPGNAIQPPVPWSLPSAHVFFGDMNGSGVDDIFVLQGNTPYYIDVEGGVRPGLLTSISNGYGATTQISYSSTHQLSLAATAAGTPWIRQSPQNLHHVTKVVSSSGVATGSTVAYSYQNPVYDGRDRSFAGFNTVTTTVGSSGDSSEPQQVTTTRFLSGICAVDGQGAACPTNPADRPFLSLRGRPVVTDTYDAAGHHLSTAHTGYHVSGTLAGLDGRTAHFAYPTEVDTYVYDASVTTSSTTLGSGTDAAFDGGTASVVSRFLLYATSAAGYHMLETTQTLDAYGRQTDSTDYGATGQDVVIDVQTTWTLPPGDPTNWQWRPLQQTRAASRIAGDLPLVLNYTYYADGQAEYVNTTVAGEVSLSRKLGGVQPGSAMANGAVLQQQFQYDSLGQLSQQSNGPQCVQVQFDAAFDQLRTSTTAYRDGCATAAAATTSGSWDRGLERVTLSVAEDNSLTSYTYDNWGRALTVVMPDPTTGLNTDSPTVTVSYAGANGTGAATSSDGYPIIQSSVTIADPTGTSPSRQTWRYADPWGRTLFNVAQADPTAGDGGNWVVTSVLRNSRGNVTWAWAPYFSTLAAGAGGTLPVMAFQSAAFTSRTYDAFGRVVKTVGLDEATVTSTHVYHLAPATVPATLEHDVTDAAGSLAKLFTDGHGRVTQTSRDVHSAAGTLDEISVRTVYSAGGSPVTVTQSHTADATTVDLPGENWSIRG
ncbi:MAG: toxin TcdB middle/N-terminal domain-containing protein [Polyangiaceae bacterium]